MATSRQKNGIFGLLMGTITFGVLFALAFFVVTSVLSVLTLGGAIAVAIAIAALVGGMAYKLKPFRETEKGKQPETDTAADTTKPTEPTETNGPGGEEKKPDHKSITIGTSLGKLFSLTQETKELTLTKANTYPVIKAEAEAKTEAEAEAKTEAKAKSDPTPQSYLRDMLEIVDVDGELRGYFLISQPKRPLSNTFLFLFFDVLAKIEKIPKMSVEDQWVSLISVCENISQITTQIFKQVEAFPGIDEFRKDLQDFLKLNTKEKYKQATIVDLKIGLPDGKLSDSWEKFKNSDQHAAGLDYAKKTFGIDLTGKEEAIKVTSLGLIT